MTDPKLKRRLEGQARHFSKLEAALNSEGGRIMVKNLEKEVEAAFDSLMQRTKAPEHELRSAALHLYARVEFLRTLKKVPKNATIAREELIKLLTDEESDAASEDSEDL
jgi:hypothetical protein